MGSTGQGTIRAATPTDVPCMVALSELARALLVTHQPRFWRPAPNAAERQRPFFESLLGRDDVIALVHQGQAAIDGFVIGTIMSAPPVYDPGGLTCVVDDLMVAAPALWGSVGHALLEAVSAAARTRGAVQLVVVTRHQDQARRVLLAERGLAIASEWHVRSI